MKKEDGCFLARRTRLIDQLKRKTVAGPAVLAAMQEVPRHLFVPAPYQHLAYDDIPLPIGCCQTISQPTTVAVMTQLLELEKDDQVLEIGTGSGYQAAILSRLSARVCTLEVDPLLASRARELFDYLGYDNITVQVGDGYQGWPHPPSLFHAICVTAAPPRIPPPLLEQLQEGGRLVIPVGETSQTQILWRVRKRQGEFEHERHGAVAFVPLVTEEQEPEEQL